MGFLNLRAARSSESGAPSITSATRGTTLVSFLHFSYDGWATSSVNVNTKVNSSRCRDTNAKVKGARHVAGT